MTYRNEFVSTRFCLWKFWFRFTGSVWFDIVEFLICVYRIILLFFVHCFFFAHFDFRIFTWVNHFASQFITLPPNGLCLSIAHLYIQIHLLFVAFSFHLFSFLLNFLANKSFNCVLFNEATSHFINTSPLVNEFIVWILFIKNVKRYRNRFAKLTTTKHWINYLLYWNYNASLMCMCSELINGIFFAHQALWTMQIP